MKFRSGFTLRKIVGENVLVAEGVENINFDKMIVLNDTAKFLWENLQNKDFTIDQAISLLTENYDVSQDLARADVVKLMNRFKKAGILIE